MRANLAHYLPVSQAQEEKWFERNMQAGDTQAWAIDAQPDDMAVGPWVHIGSAGLHENQPLERLPFAVEEVRAAIAGGAREGQVHSAGALTVFESLDTTGWLLAVTVDGAPYGLP